MSAGHLLLLWSFPACGAPLADAGKETGYIGMSHRLQLRDGQLEENATGKNNSFT